MDEIIRLDQGLFPEQLKAKWSSLIKPVDNFTITDWPGKFEDTALICDIAIKNQDVSTDRSADAIIPYLNPETADYYEVFDFVNEAAQTIDTAKSTDYADRLDKCVALASGLITGLIDVLFVGEFSIERAKQYGEKDIENIVQKTARKFGYKGNDIKGAIEHLENKFPLAADSKIDDFGGAKQHHLWDFTHHFSILGLLCSILTQFTGKVIGTNKAGMLSIKDVPDII